MRCLFVHGGSRWRKDDKGLLFNDLTFNQQIWERYRSYFGELTVVLREDPIIYSNERANSMFNPFDSSNVCHVALPDIYSPKTNFFKWSYHRFIKKEIRREVKNADVVIVRSAGNIYSNAVLKYAKAFNKPYLLEATEFNFESYWYHGIFGKLLALPKELKLKREIKNAPTVIYVTGKAMQKRYPSKGECIGCSDVDFKYDPQSLAKRLARIKETKSKLRLGTAASLDVFWKGQKDVIKALSILKKRGITNLEYVLIGAGTGEILKERARRAGVENQVIVLGSISHSRVNEWLDTLDLYIQPSYQEGLCRSLVEALGRGCPAIATKVGGNGELLEDRYLFPKRSPRKMAQLIEKVLFENLFETMAKENIAKAKKYDSDLLDQRRALFFKEFARKAANNAKNAGKPNEKKGINNGFSDAGIGESRG